MSEEAGPDPIKDIRTRLLRVPYAEPPKFAARVPTHMEFLVVDLETASGITGMGFLQPLAGGLRTLECCIHEMLEPLLLEQDAADIEGMWQRMWDATYIQGRMGITVMAMSAIDVALWDVAGKVARQPLWQLWGGKREPIPIYGSGCYRGLGKDGMIEKAQAYVARGFPAIKMQVAHLASPDEDVENVAAMRDALGDDVEIMVDVNQGWDAEEAIAIGQRLDDSNIYWLEEPVIAHDFEGYRQVAKKLKTRVVGGENHFTRYDLRPFFEDDIVPILQPDVMRGGLTELKRIAALAHNRDIEIAPHLFHELMSHLLAAIPNGSWLEYMGWHDELWKEPVTPVDGTVVPPEQPGHGLEFKAEVFSDFRLA